MMDIETTVQEFPNIDSKERTSIFLRSDSSASTIPPSETTLNNSANDDFLDDRDEPDRAESIGESSGSVACKRSDFSGNHEYLGEPNVSTSMSYDFSPDISTADNRASKKVVPGTRKVVCEGPGCYKTPSYGFEKDRRRRYCSQHKQQGMVYLKRRKCNMENCEKLSSYGRLGGSARFCLAHRSPDMVDLVNRRCEKEGCNRRPVFALPGQKARMCSNHRNLNMMDVVNQRCTFEKCSLLACYGLPGERAKSCANHRTEGMQRKKVRGSSPILPYTYGGMESNGIMKSDSLHPDRLHSLRENEAAFARRLYDNSSISCNEDQLIPQNGRNGMNIDYPTSEVQGCLSSQAHYITPNIISNNEQQKHNLSYLQAQAGLAFYQPSIPVQPSIIPNIGINQHDVRVRGYNPSTLHSYVPNNIFQEQLSASLPQVRGTNPQARLVEIPYAAELDYNHSAVPKTFGYALPASQIVGCPSQTFNSCTDPQAFHMRRQTPIYNQGVYHAPTADNLHYGLSNTIQPSFVNFDQDQLLKHNYDMQIRRAEAQKYEKMLAAASYKEELMKNNSVMANNPSNMFSGMFIPNDLKHDGIQVKGCRSSAGINNTRLPDRLSNSATLPSCSKLLGQLYNNGSEEMNSDILNMVKGNRVNGEMSDIIESMNMYAKCNSKLFKNDI